MEQIDGEGVATRIPLPVLGKKPTRAKLHEYYQVKFFNVADMNELVELRIEARELDSRTIWKGKDRDFFFNFLLDLEERYQRGEIAEMPVFPPLEEEGE